MKTALQEIDELHTETPGPIDNPPPQGHGLEQPDWSQAWPADPVPDAQSDAFLRDALSALEGRLAQERLAGYKSETQGE